MRSTDAAFLTEQVRDRYLDVGEAQFAGVLAVQSEFLEIAALLEAGCAVLDHEQGQSSVLVIAGAGGHHDEVAVRV